MVFDNHQFNAEPNIWNCIGFILEYSKQYKIELNNNYSRGKVDFLQKTKWNSKSENKVAEDKSEDTINMFLQTFNNMKTIREFFFQKEANQSINRHKEQQSIHVFLQNLLSITLSLDSTMSSENSKLLNIKEITQFSTLIQKNNQKGQKNSQENNWEWNIKSISIIKEQHKISKLERWQYTKYLPPYNKNPRAAQWYNCKTTL